MAWYSVNNLTVVQGSAIVTGDATQFSTFVHPGFGILINRVPYEIKTVDSATQLTLKESYAGVSQTDAIYSIFPTAGLNYPLWETTTELIDSFGPLRNDLDLLTSQIEETGEYADAAGASAAAALVSEGAAGASATSAGNSAANAGNSATAAAGSAISANNSKIAAAGSQTAAADSAIDANASKLVAASHAADALTHKGDALDAKNAAEGSAGAAEVSEEAAEAARDAALLAKGGSETARDGAVAAKNAAETALVGSEAARDLANAHKDAAAASEGAATNAMDAAELAKAGAETAHSAAEDALEDAVEARDTALSAKSGAETARDSAVDAKVAAEVAKEAAEAAASEAQQIVTKGAIETALGGLPVVTINTSLTADVEGNLVLAKGDVGLTDVENKSSATIRSEITFANVTGGLGFTPANKAGDTFTGPIKLQNGGTDRFSLSADSTNVTHAALGGSGHKFTTAGGGDLTMSDTGQLVSAKSGFFGGFIGATGNAGGEGGELRLNFDGNTSSTPTNNYWVQDVYQNNLRWFNVNSAGSVVSIANWAQNGSTVGFNAPTLTVGGNAVYHAGNKPAKADVGLGNVDNTSDASKPISTAVSNALGTKVSVTSGQRPGVTRLYRGDDDSSFYLMPTWNGTEWELKGYSSGDTYHAQVKVGYATTSDMVDGLHGTDLIRRTNTAGANAAWSRSLVIAGHDVTNDIWSCPLEIREVGLVGQTGNQAYSPGIVFHHASQAASALKMYPDGSLRVVLQQSSGGNYQNFWAQEHFAGGWYRTNSGGGLYFEQYQRGIVPADVVSTYGNAACYGTGRNGWTGWATSGNVCTLMTDGTNMGIHATNAGRWNVYFDGSGNAQFSANVSAYSDERLKQNRRAIDNPEARLAGMALASILYERSGETRMGFGAQTLGLSNPELVRTSDDLIGTKTVNYGDAVALVAVNAQLQADRILHLEAENASLRSTLEGVLKRLEKAGI